VPIDRLHGGKSLSPIWAPRQRFGCDPRRKSQGLWAGFNSNSMERETEETPMKVRTVFMFGAILLLGMAAWAQEFPRAEIGANSSYARYAPRRSYSQGHSLNGGGGSVTFNITDVWGIRADLQGYSSNT